MVNHLVPTNPRVWVLKLASSCLTRPPPPGTLNQSDDHMDARSKPIKSHSTERLQQTRAAAPSALGKHIKSET